MAGRYPEHSEKRVARLEKAGRGQGQGVDFQPYVRIGDLASSGRVHRRRTSRFDRVAHLLSDIEEDTFLPFDASTDVHDVREQVRLPLEDTLAIAAKYGLRHPAVRGIPTVMSTDIVADMRDRRVALAVKPADALVNRNVLVKLEIERLYWVSQGVSWYLVTDREVSRADRINLQQVFEWQFLDGCEEDEAFWGEKAAVVLLDLRKALRVSPSRRRVIDFLRAVEGRQGWRPGDGLASLKRLLALKLIVFADDRRFDPFGCLDQLALGKDA